MDQYVELRHLRYFVAVAEELHFGHAAERLHIAQPPLSQQIRRLEEEIGYPLFTRSSRSVKLTHAGVLLLERARRTLMRVSQDLEDVRSAARGESGILTIGFVGSAMLTSLPSLLGRYRRAYPEVQLRLREHNTATLVEAIRDGSIDTGFARDADPADDLHIEPMVAESFVAVVPKGHALAAKTVVPIISLKGEPFVFFARSMGNHAWEKTMKLCDEQGFRPTVVQEAPQWLTVLRLVGAGLGVTLAPASVSKIQDPGVVCKKLSPRSGSTSIDLTFLKKTPTPLVENFHVLARKLLGEAGRSKSAAKGEDRPPRPRR